MPNKLFQDVAEIKTDTKWLKEAMKVHLSQHFKVRITVLASLVAAGTAICIALFV